MMGAKGVVEIIYPGARPAYIPSKTAVYVDRFANPFIAASNGFIMR
jgi:hypothetical protein